ncbi:heme NO-binding domain-containing protein [Rhodobaculum claviforme]|uniref:Heme NO-binding domain-containing protein n=1 Tax=Rhodobaculum claviforme TaxID=1549854 RepID=A0A934WIH4_9RHOB|nr:heme NO-binding domain-containing protein [Rhodobaculum claviforme]MBK5926894.1 hypothetical protein [Rhodobaculum claviforme]
MYGMIHQALRGMAVRRIGDPAWTAVLREAGFTQPLFIGMEYYADDTTMALVRLLAARLGMSCDELLHEFGRVWIDFAGASGYGRVLRMAGDDLVTFLDCLDRMHSSIHSNMPLAQMPSFELIAADPATIELSYRSGRQGLEPFVRGILLSVAERFGETVTIDHVPQDGGARFFIRRMAAHG